jgi:hypothetical protein
MPAEPLHACAQSTLMRAISRGQLDGFPPRDVLRTVYVEHDIDASEAETPVVEFVYSDPTLQGTSHACTPSPEHRLSACHAERGPTLSC